MNNLIERLRLGSIDDDLLDAAKEAADTIESLQQGNADLEDRWAEWKDSLNSVMEQRNALQAELSKLKGAEPVAWMYQHKYPRNNLLRFDRVGEPDRSVDGWTETPLYAGAAPQAPAPLTNEQIDRAALEQTGFEGGGTQAMNITDIRRIVRAAHGITGEAQG